MGTQRDEFVFFRLRGELFGVPVATVREMLVLPACCKVPQAEGHVRGVINLRGRIMPAVDLRVLLGLGSSSQDIEDLCAALEAREQDHVRWMDELEASVRERRPFTLTLDPRACAFGRWYDAFKTDHLAVAQKVELLGSPHEAVHKLGTEVVALTGRERHEEALARIAAAREGTLRQLLGLLASVRAFLRTSHRELGMVVTSDGADAALIVDAVEAVEELAPDSIEPIPAHTRHARADYAHEMAKRASDTALLVMLDPAPILTRLHARA